VCRVRVLVQFRQCDFHRAITAVISLPLYMPAASRQALIRHWFIAIVADSATYVLENALCTAIPTCCR
jgi:hypothetical protein